VYVILWEFQARPGCKEELLAANSSDGAWSRFFGRDIAYRGTEVLHQASRVVTIDRWDSQAAYEAFRSSHAAEYQEIDRELERLTEHEHHIGSFESA
jgi:heme-degrading monooxygenase HmoA